MKKTKIFLALILIIIIVIVGALVASGSIGFGGNKVTVRGSVSYNMITGWSVSYSNSIVQPDDSLSVLWYWPWTTMDVNAKVELTENSGKIYRGETWVGTLSSIVGSSSFSVELRHIPSGSYTGTIYIYEVEKGFLWGESKRNLRATTGFQIIIS